MTILQQQALSLMQASLGIISPNFRMIYISIQSNKIVLNIIIEQEDENDREEIDELQIAFEALQETSIDYDSKILVSSDDIVWPNSESSIVTYKRRED